MADCFGTGMIVAVLRQVGTEACLREVLNRSVSTAVSSPAQCFRTGPGTPSGPVALLGLMCCRVCLTSWGLRVSTGGEGPCCARMLSLLSVQKSSSGCQGRMIFVRVWSCCSR